MHLSVEEVRDGGAVRGEVGAPARPHPQHITLKVRQSMALCMEQTHKKYEILLYFDKL